MTGPQGMGPLQGGNLGEYDLAITTMGPVFYIKPLGHMVTYTAWETATEAAEDDIATEAVRGQIYFRTWVLESGNAIDVYEDLLVFLPVVVFNLQPLSTFPTFTAWETRAEAYANDIFLTKGWVYGRAWFDDSGNSGNYEDHMNDTEMGNIFKVEDDIT